MKKAFYTLAAMVLATMAHAEPLTIAAGKPGGGYDAKAQQMATRLEQRNVDTTVVNMNGSDEISLAVCSGKADMGIMQIDAAFARSMDGCTMKAVANYGTEVAVLLVPPKAKIQKLKNFTVENRILVDTIGSGTDLFWRTIVAIDQGPDGSKDEWSKAQAVNDPLALAQPLASMNDIQAVLLVRKSQSSDISNLLSAGWTVAELWDKDVNHQMFNGVALYEPISGDLGWIYKVRSFIMTTQAIANGDRALFTSIVSASQ